MIKPLLDQCWAKVAAGGTTLNQQWLNISCLLGSHIADDIICVIQGLPARNNWIFLKCMMPFSFGP